MKRIKRIVAVMLLLFSITAVMALPANASYKYYNSYSFTTGILWWKTKYKVNVYRDPNYFTVFYGTRYVSSGFHYKGSGDLVISQTDTFSLASQTAASMNRGVDLSAYGVTASVGGSIQQTVSMSWSTSSSVTRTIDASSPRGYYSYNVCMNTYKIKLYKYTGSDFCGSIEFFAPRSQAYRAIVYNSSNATYSGVSLY